ncbi:MAG: hypothetical protein AAB367_00320 [Patescibacteria group bacterium]
MMLRILSPRGVQFEGDAKSLNTKSASGEVTILDHHHPLMTVLVRGTMVVEEISGIRREIPVESGFLEINDRNELTLLIN